MDYYKCDCHYYEEVQDMGAHIPTCKCEINNIGLGWCKCENCQWYISNTEAEKIIRNYMIDKLWSCIDGV